ncbi:hypothetical protein [Rubrivivax rivuli]|uniref:Right handed beta helix domain-containing protein n=1 Tax=Rubrivivax rivuli TaxID=1862385 RepID=A0A437RL08_9BURK|nr:hypothetical protein [Rubrivivax rivuli]RVU47439.1 hypothetical protein EOE66_06770 [Rubrivivax rivuli]
MRAAGAALWSGSRRWAWSRGVALGLCVLGACAAAIATPGNAWVVTPEGGPAALADAVARAADGDTVELMPGEYKGKLLLEQRRLTLRGTGKVVVQGAGQPGEHKALWTVRGGEVLIEGIEFRGARAKDGSGAGVLLDGGKLTLRKVQLFDNEYGLLAVNSPQAELTIENCVFGQAPKVEGGLHHLLNVGRVAKLRITGSRFQQGFEGHLIKSRAREAFIAYNFIHDGVRGGASYEIELAAGGLATVIGNVIGQGVDSQNRVLLSYGNEGRAWDRNELYVAHNTFVHYGWLPAWFMRVFDDRVGPDVRVHAVNNLLVGPGVFWLAARGEFAGNRHVTRGMLQDIWTNGFELPPGAMWRDKGVDPGKINGQDLRPQAEFEWPVGTRALQPATSWTPGAFQR